MRSVRVFILTSFLLCLMTSFAWAKGGDPCLSLARNEQWNTGLAELSANYKSKNYEAALKNADALNEICSRSPILNYFKGRIYREKGDDTKALFYIQLATNSTEEFSVKGELLEHMWYERYEIEHLEARPEKIEERQKEIAELQQRTKEAEAKLNEKTTETRFTDYDTVKSYATGMWTGVAVGAVGLVLTGVGAGMFEYTRDEKKQIEYSHKINDNNATVNPNAYVYNGMIWAGAALTIVGSVFAGIFGYKYARVEQDNAVAFDFAPNGANFSFTF